MRASTEWYSTCVTEASGEQYARCWAKRVSPCGGSMTGEHYFTRGVFLSEWLSVSGGAARDDRPSERHIDSLVTRVLCEKHNAGLGDLDQALIDFVNAFRELERLRAIRGEQKSPPWYAPVRLVVDGPRIERCLLKMTMNYARVFRSRLGDWAPPGWLPDVIFGNESLRAGCGLSIVARVGDSVEQSEKFAFHFGEREKSGQPEVVFLDLRNGWQILCTWARPAKDLGTLVLGEKVYTARGDVMFHPRRLNFEDRGRDLGLSLDFDWTGRWSSARNRSVVRLRSRYKAPPRTGRRGAKSG